MFKSIGKRIAMTAIAVFSFLFIGFSAEYYGNFAD